MDRVEKPARRGDGIGGAAHGRDDRDAVRARADHVGDVVQGDASDSDQGNTDLPAELPDELRPDELEVGLRGGWEHRADRDVAGDRKSTRLNSSHLVISY